MRCLTMVAATAFGALRKLALANLAAGRGYDGLEARISRFRPFGYHPAGDPATARFLPNAGLSAALRSWRSHSSRRSHINGGDRFERLV
jgi:hypothetical protein